jgi:hypothetical protein
LLENVGQLIAAGGTIDLAAHCLARAEGLRLKLGMTLADVEQPRHAATVQALAQSFRNEPPSHETWEETAGRARAWLAGHAPPPSA